MRGKHATPERWALPAGLAAELRSCPSHHPQQESHELLQPLGLPREGAGMLRPPKQSTAAINCRVMQGCN